MPDTDERKRELVMRLRAARRKKAKLRESCPIVYDFVANSPQDAFLKSEAHEAWAIGGNQSGKTYIVVGFTVQKCSFMTKYRVRVPNGDPDWRKWPIEWTECLQGPDKTLKFRYMALDFNKVHEIVLPHFYSLLPPALIEMKRGTKFPGYNTDTHILYIKDPRRPGKCHEVHFATYDQDLHKIEGGAFDYVLYDEPPPKSIYKGNKVRLLAHGGKVRGALTPIEEIPWPIEWIHHDIVCKADGKRIACFQLPTMTNMANLNEAEFAEMTRDMTEHQKRVRLMGEFGFLRGLVYKQFNRDLHVVEGFDVRQRVAEGRGLIYVGLDHGYRNPEAASWWYVEGAWPDVRGWKFKEYMASGFTVDQNCAAILEHNEGLPVEAWFGDPVSYWRTDETTGTLIVQFYWDNGIPVQKGDNDVTKGHLLVASLLEPLPDEMGKVTPRIKFFECLEESITAYMSYAWRRSATKHGEDTKEKPEEKYKHIPDTDRYVWTAMPSGVPMEAMPEPVLGHFGYPLTPVSPEVAEQRKRAPQDVFMEQELQYLGALPSEEADVRA